MKIANAMFVLILVLASCQNKNVKSKNRNNNTATNIEEKRADSIKVHSYLNENPYPYDTTLINGYHLKHKVSRDLEYGDFLQSLTLYEGSLKIREFSPSSFGLPYKNIGYVGADFEDSFMIFYSFGSGNEHLFELIHKKTGQLIEEGIWVDDDIIRNHTY